MCSRFPKRLEIELSNSCNLSCSYCPRRFLASRGGLMDFGLFQRLIGQAAHYPRTILVLHRRGESLLHPDFARACDYVKGKFKNIQLATNATLLNGVNSRAIIEAVSFISFSIDLPEVFNQTRATALYQDVEQKIHSFLSLNKGRVETQVSMVKTKDTPLGSSERFKQIWLGKVDRVRIYEEHSQDGVFGSLCQPRKKRLPCAMPDYEMLVYYDGKVGRCNHDWEGEPMGDAIQQPLGEIWLNEKYSRLRQQQRSLKIIDAVCANCDSWYAEAGAQGTGELISND